MAEQKDWSEWTAEHRQGLMDMIEASSDGEESAGQVPEGATALASHRALKEAVAAGDIAQFFSFAERAVRASVEGGQGFEEVLRGLARSSERIVAALSEAYAQDSRRLVGALEAYVGFKDHLAAYLGGVYARHREEVILKEQKRVIRELSTPVIQLWDGILVMPLIGVIDSDRASQMMEQLLERITGIGSRVVILDITGVPTVDTDIANHLMRTMRAARLVGAQSILVGISPQVAQTLVRLNVSFPGLETYPDLSHGLSRALELMGRRVVRSENGS